MFLNVISEEMKCGKVGIELRKERRITEEFCVESLKESGI